MSLSVRQPISFLLETLSAGQHCSAAKFSEVVMAVEPGCTPLPSVSPRPAAGGTLVNGPLRQSQPWRDIGEHHAHAGADAYPLDLALRREHAVRPRQVADHAESLLPGWHAALRVQFDQQDEIRRVLLERRLNGMVDLGVGMHGAAALDRYPFRFQLSAPRARRRRRVAEQLARGTSLQAEIVLGTKGEVVEV